MKKNNTKCDKQVQYKPSQDAADRDSGKILLKGESEPETGAQESQANVTEEQTQPGQTDDQSVPGDEQSNRHDVESGNLNDDSTQVPEQDTYVDLPLRGSSEADKYVTDIKYSEPQYEPPHKPPQKGIISLQGRMLAYANKQWSGTDDGSEEINTIAPMEQTEPGKEVQRGQ